MRRIAAVVVAAALTIPAESSGQVRLPVIGRPGPTRPAPLPPQPEPIARNLAYKRLRLAVESYPLITYARSPLTGGDGVSDWTSFGTGTRADYRLTRTASLTLDLTSSFAGGPVDVHTLEVGTRLRPERSERRAYPFVDLRLGIIAAASSYFDGIQAQYSDPAFDGSGAFRYSSGFGGVAGVGMEYTLTRTLSLTTAASMMRNRMTATTLVGATPGERSYTMSLYRYTIGIRYNPIRWVHIPGTDTY